MREFQFKQKSTTCLCALIITVILCICFPSNVNAQDTEESDTSKYHIETMDGNEFQGTIIYKDSSIIKLETSNLGIITIKRSDIRIIEKIAASKIVNGEYWPENFQESRYFWQPSGYGLKKGEGYYQNVWIFFNQFAVGVSDNFSIGGGLVPTFFFGTSAVPIWANLKFSIPVTEDKFNVGAGGLFGTVTGEGTNFGILYGITTFGSRNSNVSTGFGWAYSDDGIAKRPTITFSGMFRTGKKGYFLTENYLISTGSETSGMISIGGRSLQKKVGIDYGLFIPIVDGGVNIAIPWLGLTIPFGTKPKRP